MVIEGYIKVNILYHLRKHGLMSKHQHGFLSKRSITTQLLACVNDWSSYLNMHNSVDTVNINFTKAFDSVAYNKFMARQIL